MGLAGSEIRKMSKPKQLFKFRWYRKAMPTSFRRQGGNRWFTNTFRDWDDCEARIRILEIQKIEIVWITAYLDT